MTNDIFVPANADPVALFLEWLTEARQSEINDPEAMCLATCDAGGQPRARMVLLKDCDERGFKFHTNTESRKGQDLHENPLASLCFHWKSLRRQIRVEGRVSLAPRAESDAYFATRPLARQIGAWASAQSRPLDNRQTLEQKTAEIAALHKGQDIPRPPYWQGYILAPALIEFWHDNPDRLHDRFIFTRLPDGNWSAAQRLYP